MLIILCGPAGAGKTTISKELQERLADDGRDFGVIHSDDYSRNTYDQMYETVKDSDENWILDGTFYKKEWRDMFSEFEDLKTIWVKADLETCVERNQMRNDPIEEKAVYIIWNAFEEPDADLIIESDNMSVGEAVDTILERGEYV